jgi:Gametolysin peptidase M11/NPCBM-associated, NEW3 domain of alpha-galactosidase
LVRRLHDGPSVLENINRVLLVVLGTVVFTATASAAPGNGNAGDRRRQANDLTQSLVSLDSRYRNASKQDKPRIADEMSSTARDRKDVLLSLMEDDPAGVLGAAVPEEFRDGLPSEVQELVEREIDAAGELAVLIEDHPGFSKLRYRMKSAKGWLSLHFANDPPTQISSGSEVQVQGVEINGEVALYSGSTSVQTVSASTTAAPLANTFGAQQTLVILVNFQDAPTQQPWTISDVQSAVFGTSGASGFMQENSYGQTWLTGDVQGWYTIPESSTTCNPSQIATDADNAAAAAGVNVASYSHKVYVFPNDSACGWSGMAGVGGSPSLAWVTGDINPVLFAHELGHGFGLLHSHGLDCGTAVIGTNCTTLEYGNMTDTMGALAGDYDTFQKERLGWINYGSSPSITTVNVSGTYDIDPWETNGTNPKALKILKSTDPTTGLRTWYYVEYRQALGWDQALLGYQAGNNNFTNGVLVTIGTESTPNSGSLLNMTPGTWGEAALVVGQTFTDPNAGVTITTQSVSGSGASVQVIVPQATATTTPTPTPTSTPTSTCAHANPSLAVSPSTNGSATTKSYTLTVTNNDDPNCSAASFNLAASVPSGWSAAFGSSSLTLSPGASGSTTTTLSSGSSPTAGTYMATFTASNAANPGYSASATVTFAAGLNVTVATDKGSYSPGSTVTITAIVASGGSPVSGAAVTFTLMRPNGSQVTGTGTTSSNGTASYVYKLKRSQNMTGTWRVIGMASASGASGSGATVFSVQ